MRQQLQYLLAYLSRKIIAKYKPFIIGITGSVGKTSTRDAVFCVVKQKFTTRKSEKNYNNEFGLPFTIIGISSPGRNVGLWIMGIFKALWLIVRTQKYPEVLVLEMGVDKPGDMDYLLSIASPNIALITSIGVSHYEFFQTPEAIAQEKGKIAEFLPKEGTLILNADSEIVLNQKNKTSAHVLTYGMNNADTTLSITKENLELHASTECVIKNTDVEFKAVIHALGNTHIYSILAAAAVAKVLKIDPTIIVKGISEYRPVPGRLNVIPGIKRSIILDDTYNAAPDSMNEAIALLKRFPGTYKIAVLGDMLELGTISDQAHIALGENIAKIGINRLITVGPQGKIIAESAQKNGMQKERVLSVDTSEQAQIPLQNLLPKEAIILIKGSQGMRMEKITKEIMAEPMKAHQVLCRQYGKWL